MLSNLFVTKSGTTVKDVISEGQAKGRAFITEKHQGKGKIILLGSMPTGDEGNALINDATNDVELSYTLDVDPGIVVIPRQQGDNNKQLWIVNFANEVKVWQADKPYLNLLKNEKTIIGKNHLPPFAYAVLME